MSREKICQMPWEFDRGEAVADGDAFSAVFLDAKEIWQMTGIVPVGAAKGVEGVQIRRWTEARKNWG